MTLCLHRQRGSGRETATITERLGPVRKTSPAREIASGTGGARAPDKEHATVSASASVRSGSATCSRMQSGSAFGQDVEQIREGCFALVALSPATRRRMRILEDRTSGFGPPAGSQAGRRRKDMQRFTRATRPDDGGHMVDGSGSSLPYSSVRPPEARRVSPKGRCSGVGDQRSPAPRGPGRACRRPRRKARVVFGQPSGTAKRGDRGPAAMPAPICVYEGEGPAEPQDAAAWAEIACFIASTAPLKVTSLRARLQSSES